MLPLCLHFSKQQCLSLSTFLFETTLALWGQLFSVRMFDIHVTFIHFKFYPWTFQEVPKTTLFSKLAAKAATVPETPVQDSKPSPKKTVTPKKDKKMSIRKLQPKEHQRCQNQRKWLKFHPHWKRKSLATVVLWQEMVLGHLVQRKSLRLVSKSKIWLLILSSCCQTFSCKLIKRICC